VIPFRALSSDVAQRLLTLNKLEERRALSAWVQRLHLRPGARILDFGCGTGLFAATLRDAGLTYCGFDPDADAVRYALHLYPGLTFVTRLEEAATAAPFDAILANCCFHHISDDDLLNTTLPAIAGMMQRDSVFMLMDVLPLEKDASMSRRIYNVFEQGASKRTASELERLLAGRFGIRSRRVRRSFLLSASFVVNPVYNEVIVYELALA
jgi:SAM-dependent methyltransferase